MILKDVIRYYELTGCDFQQDVKDFGDLQREFYNDIIDNNFTERYESFTDKLQELWVDRKGGWESVTERSLQLPSNEQLIHMYCKTIEEPEKQPEKTVTFLTNSALRKKKKAENKTLDLIATLTDIEIPFDQFAEYELEVVYAIIGLVGEKKKEAEKKRRQRRKR